MKNQMSAFSAITKQFDQPFQGTIIRIPLRTAAQAEASEICNRSTTLSDVVEVVRKFVSEFGTSGLLFLKNIENIMIEIGDSVAFNIEIANAIDVRRQKKLVNEMIKKAFAEPNSTFDVSFDVEIETGSKNAKSRTSFAIHHSIGTYPVDEKLRDWCKAQVMIPWIAVAAQIPVNL